MGIFDFIRDKRTVMTYEYHGNLYSDNFLSRLDEQYRNVAANPNMRFNIDHNIIRGEMAMLAFALDIHLLRKTFGDNQFPQIVTPMTEAIIEGLELSSKQKFLDTVTFYNKEISEAMAKKIHPITHCSSLLRSRCLFNGSDEIETNILAQAVSNCQMNWKKIKEDYKFLSESDAANKKTTKGNVIAKSNSLPETAEEVLSLVYGKRISAEQINKIVNEFDNWADSECNTEIMQSKIILISSGELNSKDAAAIMNLLILGKNDGFGQMWAQLGAGTTGTTLDEIPGGVGDYGYAATNPIPTHGISGSEDFLNSLYTREGAKIKWNRVGSISVKNLKYPVDIYAINEYGKEEEIARLYLSPYNKRTSVKPPGGFYLGQKY